MNHTRSHAFNMHFMVLFEGLRFRRPGKRDPKSCHAHHPRSFDRAQCNPSPPSPSPPPPGPSAAGARRSARQRARCGTSPRRDAHIYVHPAPTPVPGDAAALAKVRGPIEGQLVGGILRWLTTERCTLRASAHQGAAEGVSVRGRGRGRGERGLSVGRMASPGWSGHSKSRRRRGDSTAFATRKNA